MSDLTDVPAPHGVSAFPVRPMTVDDCARVAGIRAGGWRHAYRGLVPQPYLDRMDIAADAGRHRARLLSRDGGRGDLVAEGEGGAVVGWAAFGPYRDGEVRTDDAELYALYLDPGHIGRGVGRTLLAEVTRRCAAAGHRDMYLWVLKENARARRFYERAGFGADGAEEPFEVDGVAVPEVRYAKRLAD
ncbi:MULTISPECIES: GNAT family N-acetyltransferase [unclassified Streptomyces]|uniref:GNAT family N-acetyltransferase n=1 Tax=unclassified Streptomyces TaxID=2593676 RepID=UPI001F0C3C3E|nr:MULTISPECIES: GNAT family N-acetyltransferase [unclassified Streptomyces]